MLFEDDAEAGVLEKVEKPLLFQEPGLACACACACAC